MHDGTLKPLIRVLNLFKIKSESEGALKFTSKNILNNLIGRLGLNIIKPITEYVSKIKLQEIISTREIYSILNINENNFLITYNPLISKDICLEPGLDFLLL